MYFKIGAICIFLMAVIYALSLLTATTTVPRVPRASHLANGKISEKLTRLCESCNEFYHNETGECYSLRFKFGSSPCGLLQHFYPVSEEFGACSCVWDNGLQDCSQLNIRNRPVLNWPGSDRCYYAYEQGPCRANEWIVMNRKTLQSECRPNPCHSLKLEDPDEDIRPFPKDPTEVFWFLENSTCYQTFTRAFCKRDEYVRFTYTNPEPSCFKRWPESFRLEATRFSPLRCKQGWKKIGDDCAPIADKVNKIIFE